MLQLKTISFSNEKKAIPYKKVAAKIKFLLPKICR